MKPGRTHQVKELAQATGVSVRTLHHYDAIGLLVPSARSAAGYRLYTQQDVLRLQHILVARELGLALHEIGRLLDDPALDRRALLLAQRQQLQQRARQTQAMLGAIDHALLLLDEPREDTMTADLKKLFDGFDPTAFDAEVEQRWGDTELFRISRERTRRYTKADWQAQKAELDAIHQDAAHAMQQGLAPGSPAAMDIAERHRLSLERWFYPCSHTHHVALADMYEADERFAANINRHAPGLTPFFSAAIRANAQRPR